VDQRVLDRWVDLTVSLGDFVLSGGELPALVLVDGVVRLIPGVLGNLSSAPEDSFSTGLLEHPQYTKPRLFLGEGVPEVLLSGHHAKIEMWKLRESLELTYALRPDLIRDFSGEHLPDWACELLAKLKDRLGRRFQD
jgi:tRNA (guanine37-N1)-methyltransferase